MNKELKKLLKTFVSIEVLTIFVTFCLQIFFNYWDWMVYPYMCGAVLFSFILSVIIAPILNWWMKDEKKQA